MDIISVTESELRTLIRRNIMEAMDRIPCLSEKFEVLGVGDDEANRTVREIYIDYLAKYKPMLKSKRGVETITLGPYTFLGCIIYIYVDDSEWPGATKPCYHGYFSDRGTYRSITITFNNIAMQTFYTFRAALLHEMTHMLDNRRHKTKTYNQGWYKMSDRFQNTNLITNIIYRLWTAGERNAYTTYGYSKDSTMMKEYIESLRHQIDIIEKDTTASDEYWRNVGEYLFVERIKPNTPVSAIKSYFIKKSRYLLNQFEKKCWQRHGQHYNDSDTMADLKSYDYEAKNIKIIKTLKDDMLYDILKHLSREDGTFNDWFALKKAKYPKLTNKLAKYVWDNEIPRIAKALRLHEYDDDNLMNWLDKIGY